MSGKAPRQKGSRFEREIVDELRAAGLDAHRIPLSGAQRGFKGDVQIRFPDRTLTLEAKVRKSGFAFIYNAIEGNDALCVKVDRGEPLLIMRLADAAAILGQSVRVERQPSAPTTTKANEQRQEKITEMSRFIADETMRDVGVVMSQATFNKMCGG